jgi:hypothetical protein
MLLEVALIKELNLGVRHPQRCSNKFIGFISSPALTPPPPLSVSFE